MLIEQHLCNQIEAAFEKKQLESLQSEVNKIRIQSKEDEEKLKALESAGVENYAVSSIVYFDKLALSNLVCWLFLVFSYCDVYCCVFSYCDAGSSWLPSSKAVHSY